MLIWPNAGGGENLIYDRTWGARLYGPQRNRHEYTICGDWNIAHKTIDPGLKNLIRSASIYEDQRFSGHAPLTIDYNLTL